MMWAKYWLAAVGLTLGSPVISMEPREHDLAGYEAEAVALVKEFSGQLKPRLKGAIDAGGFAHAVSVCADQAPAIATKLSDRSGWRISRVSERNRNPQAVPDAWEAGAMALFNAQKVRGEAAEKLAFGEMTADGYRYARAQVVEPLCLACHGSELAPSVAAALAERYPDDKAVGYELGDIRGMFSLQAPPID